MTNKDRIVRYVQFFPGKSAVEVSNALRLKAASVSSTLCACVKDGLLYRVEGKGPRGGWGYFFKRGKTRLRFKRVLDDYIV